MKKLVFAFIVAALTVSTSAAFAQGATNEDWLDKNMGFGIGGGRTLGSGPGLSLRFFPIEVFGLELVFGGNSSKRTTQAVPTQANQITPEIIERTSEVAMSLFTDFRFLRSNRSALSGFFGLGIVNNGRRGTIEQNIGGGVVGTKVTNSWTDIHLSLGIRGEIFLYEFFSVHGRVGIDIDPFSDAEGDFQDNPLPDPTAPTIDTTDYGGVDINIFDNGDLFGSFGFTLWFN